MECVWNITVPDGYIVRLLVNYKAKNYSCNVPYGITIHDGPRSSSVLLARFCDLNEGGISLNVMSTGSSVLFELKTGGIPDHVIMFEASYQALPKSSSN